MPLQGRHPRESEAVLTELMMPNHANIMGNVFGGHILSLIDRVAAVAAIRHSVNPASPSRGQVDSRSRSMWASS